MFSPFSFQTLRVSFGTHNLLRAVAMALLVLGLSACGVMKVFAPYTIEVRQGNYVTQEMVSQLTPGMTQEQVRFIMGSPLLVDPFHANRWDYVYRVMQAGEVKDQRRITLMFKDNLLNTVDGDVVAAIPASSSGKP